jgi:ribosomal protein L11 methyltransferase
VTIDVPAESADEIAGWLGPGTLGVECVPIPGDRTSLRVYLDREPDAADIRETLAVALRAVGLPREGSPIRVEGIEDGRWVEAYQAGLRPIPIGERFVVLPADEGAVVPGREPIRLVPGRAFGTGEHATTRLCAVELEREVGRGSAWLDLGTGSGILALIAIRCGAARVRGVDVDPDAIEVAREVSDRNGADPRLEWIVGSASDEPVRGWDAVVANISETYFLTEAEAIARVLRPGGVLVASGFLEADAAEVEAALGGAGLHVVRRSSETPWAGCVARLDAADSP